MPQDQRSSQKYSIWIANRGLFDPMIWHKAVHIEQDVMLGRLFQDLHGSAFDSGSGMSMKGPFKSPINRRLTGFLKADPTNESVGQLTLFN